MNNRYWKNEKGEWFWHKDEYQDKGPFSSRAKAKNDYAKYCERTATPQIIGRLR